MDQGETWIVRIHNDDFSPFATVIMAAADLLGFDLQLGDRLARVIHEGGWADLPTRGRGPAEELVAAFGVRGLRATLRAA